MQRRTDVQIFSDVSELAVEINVRKSAARIEQARGFVENGLQRGAIVARARHAETLVARRPTRKGGQSRHPTLCGLWITAVFGHQTGDDARTEFPAGESTSLSIGAVASGAIKPLVRRKPRTKEGSTDCSTANE